MRLLRVLALALLAASATIAVAPAASAAPEPCVTIYGPFYPGYAGPTCLSDLRP